MDEAHLFLDLTVQVVPPLKHLFECEGTTQCGTPNYFSPEMVNGEPYGPASDVWAVGVLAYEILTLRHPFTGRSLAALLRRITMCEYDEVRLREAPYPDEIKVVASGAELMHLDPSKRLTLAELLGRPAFTCKAV